MRINKVIGASVAALVAITLFAGTADAIVIALDNASDPAYAANPTDGAWQGQHAGAGFNPPGNDNGGSGFLPWIFGGYSQDGPPYGIYSHFIDGVDFPTTSFNNLGAPAFGLGTEPLAFFGITTGASRPFVQPLAVGDKFSAAIDTPAEYDDHSGFGFPFAIVSFTDATGADTFVIEAGSSVVYGDFNWRFTDSTRTNADFGTAAGGAPITPTATSDGSSISLEMLTATTGRVTLDGVSLDITFKTGVPKAVAFTLFDNNGEAAVISGDYNDNGKVDAADYVVWRDNLGQAIQLPNEGEGVTPGSVTQEDYATWRTNFGAAVGPTGEHAFFFNNLKIDHPSGSGASAVTTPEPTTTCLAVIACLACVSLRRNWRN